jgi:hypothetical protein
MDVRTMRQPVLLRSKSRYKPLVKMTSRDENNIDRVKVFSIYNVNRVISISAFNIFINCKAAAAHQTWFTSRSFMFSYNAMDLPRSGLW